MSGAVKNHYNTTINTLHNSQYCELPRATRVVYANHPVRLTGFSPVGGAGSTRAFMVPTLPLHQPPIHAVTMVTTTTLHVPVTVYTLSLCTLTVIHPHKVLSVSQPYTLDLLYLGHLQSTAILYVTSKENQKGLKRAPS